MKLFYSVLAVAVIASVVFGTSLSRVLFEMFFLWWVPAGLIFAGAMFWLTRGGTSERTPAQWSKSQGIERAEDADKRNSIELPKRDD